MIGDMIEAFSEQLITIALATRLAREFPFVEPEHCVPSAWRINAYLTGCVRKRYNRPVRKHSPGPAGSAWVPCS